MTFKAASGGPKGSPNEIFEVVKIELGLCLGHSRAVGIESVSNGRSVCIHRASRSFNRSVALSPALLLALEPARFDCALG